MKNIQKLFAISCLILSTNIFAIVNNYGFTLRIIDFCTDWSCTAPFNAFTGSQYVAVNETGAVPGADTISVNLPTSGTYGYIRYKVKNEFKFNGYGEAEGEEYQYCATGSSSDYATEALAKAAATDTTYVMQLAEHFSWGNGVDAAGYGDISYGYGAGQNDIPGYTSHWSASTLNKYAYIFKREETNDEFFLTTVLQGDYDFGSGEIPSTINLGIEASNSVLIMFSTCDTSAINRGRCTSAAENNCIPYLGEPLFDFVIQ